MVFLLLELHLVHSTSPLIHGFLFKFTLHYIPLTPSYTVFELHGFQKTPWQCSVAQGLIVYNIQNPPFNIGTINNQSNTTHNLLNLQYYYNINKTGIDSFQQSDTIYGFNSNKQSIISNIINIDQNIIVNSTDSNFIDSEIITTSQNIATITNIKTDATHFTLSNNTIYNSLSTIYSQSAGSAQIKKNIINTNNTEYYVHNLTGLFNDNELISNKPIGKLDSTVYTGNDNITITTSTNDMYKRRVMNLYERDEKFVAQLIGLMD